MICSRNDLNEESYLKSINAFMKTLIFSGVKPEKKLQISDLNISKATKQKVL